MHYRETIIEDDKTLDDSGSVSIPINVIDPITELILKFKVTNTSGVSADVPPEMSIDKIEITDGGKVYGAMTGYEAVAAAGYDKGFWPPHWYNEYGGGSQRISIPLQFGRFIGDPEFAFDPTKLKNPALKFTFSKETAHEADSLRLGVLAKIMEGVPGPSKCLLYRSVEAFVSGSSGVHVVDLLTDQPYRRLLVRGYLYGSTLANIIPHLKLDCDVGRLVVFDHDAAEWQDLLRSARGPFQLRKLDCFETGAIDYKNCHIAGRTTVQGSVGTQKLFSHFWASGADYYGMRVTDDSGADIASNVQVLITGEFPHNVYCYEFGRPNDPETWFRAQQYKDIDLKLTQGVDTSAISVLLQQPVPLP